MRSDPDRTPAASPGGSPADVADTEGCVRAARRLRPAPGALCALATLAALAAVPTGAPAAQSRSAGPGPPEARPHAAPPAAAPLRGGDPLSESGGGIVGGEGSTRPDTAAGPTLLDRRWETWAREAAAAASLLTLDRPVRSAAQELRSNASGKSAVDRVADRAEWFGDWEASLPWLVGSSLAVGQLTGGHRGLRRGAALLAGTAAASTANEALNRAVGRGRPSWEEGAFSLDPFRGHASFPSGHTAYVFGVASGIDVVTDGWPPAAAAYGVAGLTALSRIYHDRHWLTDVVGSAALSTVVSRLATREALGVLGVRDGEGDGREAGGGAESGRGRGAGVDPLLAPGALGVTVRF